MTMVGEQIIQEWANGSWPPLLLKGITRDEQNRHTISVDPLPVDNLAQRINAAVAEAYEDAARYADGLAEMRESGAGDSPPGHRLRQVARAIRTLARERTGSVKGE